MPTLLKRMIAAVLCAGMLLGIPDGRLAFAQQTDRQADAAGCEHHMIHTDTCGYAEAVEGQPCGHQHDDACGYEADAEQPFCSHTHDADCGYVEAEAGSPCGFVCEICAATVVDWVWQDVYGALCTGAQAGVDDVDWVLRLPESTDDVLQTLLPAAITATMKNGAQMTLSISWDLSTPGAYGLSQGANAPFALYTAALPAGYTLDAAAPALQVLVERTEEDETQPAMPKEHQPADTDAAPLTGQPAQGAALTDGVKGGELHFIVRHWHAAEDKNTQLQGDDTATSGDFYFVMVEGYIVPQPDGTFKFYLVYQSDTADGAHKAGERVEILDDGSFSIDDSTYVEDIDPDTGVIILAVSPIAKTGANEEYVEHFSSFSVSAGHDAVTNNGDTLTITYDPYVHLVKAHAFYIRETVDVDTGIADDTVFGSSGIARKYQDTAQLYKYAEDYDGHKAGEVARDGSGRPYQAGDALPPALADKVVLDKFYDTGEGLHTDKTATEVQDGTGRTFALELESWFSQGYAPQIGLILDASGSMVAASDRPAPVHVSDAEIARLGINQLTGDGAGDPSEGWDNYFLRDDQLDQILDIHKTDNSLLSASGYSYFVRDGVEYDPLGYWQGVRTTYAFEDSGDTSAAGVQLNSSNGLQTGNNDAGKAGILLDAKPSTDSFTISFLIKKTAEPAKDQNTIAQFMYIGPYSGDTTAGGYYNVYRDTGTSSARLRGNQSPVRGGNVTDLNTVFGRTDTYRITLVFDNVSLTDSSRPASVTSYRSNAGGTGTGTTSGTDYTYGELGTPITDLNIILNGTLNGYTGGSFFVDELYVIDEALDAGAVGDLHKASPSYTGDRLIGLYAFNGDLANSAKPGASATKLVQRVYFAAGAGNGQGAIGPGVAETWDGAVLGSFNRINGDAKGTAPSRHLTQPGWYYVTHSGAYDNHYAYLGTGKRLVGLDGTQENGFTVADSIEPVEGDPAGTAAANTGYTYTNSTSDTPTRFYVDGEGYLRCFYERSNNKNVYCSYIYQLDDSQYIRTEALQRALGVFVTRLDEYSPVARVSAVRFSTGDINDDELAQLVLQDWTDDPAESTGMMSLEYGTGAAQGSATGSTPGSTGLAQYNYGLTGSTSTWRGLQAYKDNLLENDDPYKDAYGKVDVPKYLIIFTDGADSDIGTKDAAKAAQIAKELKEDYGYTIYTILLDGETMPDDSAEYEKAYNFLLSLAGTRTTTTNAAKAPYVYSVNLAEAELQKSGVDTAGMSDADLLTQILVQRILIEKIIRPLLNYSVQDYIDPRFDLVDHDGVVWELNAGGSVTRVTPGPDGKPAASEKIQVNDPSFFTVEKDGVTRKGVKITLSEDSDETARTPYLRYDEKRDLYYLEWLEQSIPNSAVGATRLAVWNAVVTIRAKDDFLGGNAVLTNGNETMQNFVYHPLDENASSGWDAGLPKASGVAAQGDGQTVEYYSRGFPRVAVNVTPPHERLRIDRTIYLSEELHALKIAEDVINTTKRQAKDNERYYWEYLERFVAYFRQPKNWTELRNLYENTDENGNPDPLVTKRLYETAMGQGDDADPGGLTVSTLSRWLIEDRANGLRLPYIYLPDLEQSNAVGTVYHTSDVLGQLHYQVKETFSNVPEGTTPPAGYDVYPNGPTTHTISRKSELTVTYYVDWPDDRVYWNNEIVRDPDYRRDKDYKPAVGTPVLEEIVVQGDFETRIVSGEIALQMVVDANVPGTVSYRADLMRTYVDAGGVQLTEKVGVLQAAGSGGSTVTATLTELADGYKDMALQWGLPLGRYTLENGQGINLPDGYGVGELELIQDKTAYAASLFSVGTGCDTPGRYLAAVDGDAFVLGNDKRDTDDRLYTDYRFGLYRVRVEHTGEHHPSKRTPAVDTSDNSNARLWGVLLAVSCTGLGVCLYWQERKRRK